MTPRPISTTAPAAPTSKKQIDLHEALTSTLRAWLATRDSLLWLFCSGTDVDDRLESMAPAANVIEAAVKRMNDLRESAIDFARTIGGRARSPEAVISDAMDELLAAESPKFLLHVDNLPGSF